MSWYRKPGKASKDANQKAIVDGLRACGLAVYELNDVIDLIVSDPAEMWLVEIKNKAGRNRLEKSQKEFLASWRGKPVIIGRTLEEILRAMGKLR